MKPILLALNLLCSADAATTHYAIHKGLAHEVVWPSQNPYVLDSIAAAEAGATSATTLWLDRRHHPKMARIVGWTAIGIRGAIVVSNFHQIRKTR